MAINENVSAEELASIIDVLQVILQKKTCKTKRKIVGEPFEAPKDRSVIEKDGVKYLVEYNRDYYAKDCSDEAEKTICDLDKGMAVVLDDGAEITKVAHSLATITYRPQRHPSGTSPLPMPGTLKEWTGVYAGQAAMVELGLEGRLVNALQLLQPVDAVLFELEDLVSHVDKGKIKKTEAIECVKVLVNRLKEGKTNDTTK